MTFWFILLILGGFWLVLSTIEFLTGLDDLLLEPSKGNVLFGIFFFFLAKSATETLEGSLRDKSQKHFFSSPIKPDSIFFSKFSRVFFYNILLFGVAMTVVSFVVKVWNFTLPVDSDFFVLLYLLVILAPILGFNSSLLIHMMDKRLKLTNAIFSGFSILMILILLHSNIRISSMIYYTILMVFGTLLISVFSCRWMYREVWTRTSQSSENSSLRKGMIKLPKLIPKDIRVIAEVELTRRCRRKQIQSSIIVVTLMGVGLGFFYLLLGPTPNIGLGLDEYFYPAFVSMTVFIATVIHVLIPSLDLFSRDGKRLWCIRSLPKSLEDIVMGKALAIIIQTPIIIAAVALPLPLILDYPFSYVFLSGMVSLTMILLMSGIGIWAAVKFPNFNESTKGAPDIITMYSTVMLGLFLSTLFLAIPLSLVEIDIILSMLMIILTVDLALLFLVLILKQSSKILKKMDFVF